MVTWGLRTSVSLERCVLFMDNVTHPERTVFFKIRFQRKKLDFYLVAHFQHQESASSTKINLFTMDHSCIGKYLFYSVVFFLRKTVLSLDIIKHCHQPCLRMSKTHQGLVLLLSIINPSSVLWTTFALKVDADSLPHEEKQFCLLLLVHVLILSARRAKLKTI